VTVTMNLLPIAQSHARDRALLRVCSWVFVCSRQIEMNCEPRLRSLLIR
jgi:hypothetical protein